VVSPQPAACLKSDIDDMLVWRNRFLNVKVCVGAVDNQVCPW
jgi:hypothetical protein